MLPVAFSDLIDEERSAVVNERPPTVPTCVSVADVLPFDSEVNTPVTALPSGSEDDFDRETVVEVAFRPTMTSCWIWLTAPVVSLPRPYVPTTSLPVSVAVDAVVAKRSVVPNSVWFVLVPDRPTLLVPVVVSA